MYCTSCGATISEGVKFCPVCGTPVEGGTSAGGDDLTRHVTDDIDFGAVTTNNEIPLTLGDISGGVEPAHTGTRYAPTGDGTNPSSTYQAPGYQTGPIQQRPSNGGNGMLIGIIAALVIALIGGMAFFFLSGPDEEEVATYRVSYETSGGTSIAAIQVEDGDTITTPQDPGRDGYVFKGWYLDSSYSESVSFPYVVTEDTVLYAKWEEAPKEEEEKEEVAEEQPAEDTSSSSNESTQQTTTTTTTAPATPQYNVTTLTCVGADGTTRTETIRRQPGTEFVLLDGNSRYYSEAEVASLSDAERCIAWNEIIAASNGYDFMNSGLRAYFANCSWYYPVAGASGGGNLTSAGSANVELLKAYTSSWWKNLATY